MNTIMKSLRYAGRLNWRTFFPTALLVGVVVFGSGCRTRLYSLILGNDGKAQITDAVVVYGSGSIKFGNVMPTGSTGYGTMVLRIPETATLMWTQKNGRAFQQTIEIRPLVEHPRTFDGAIWIRLNDEGQAKVELKK